jgi:hypothetical protein
VTERQQKITFAEMRASGVRGLLIYCSDYKCSHSTAISGDRWPDDVRLSDIEPKFTARRAAREALMCGQTFRWQGWERDEAARRRDDFRTHANEMAAYLIPMACSGFRPPARASGSSRSPMT